MAQLLCRPLIQEKSHCKYVTYAATMPFLDMRYDLACALALRQAGTAQV